jgi:5-methylcytosine-specific restriction endonuclease McrA
MSKSFVCIDCHSPFESLYHAKRCLACRPAAEEMWHRIAKGAWKKRSRAAGTHCSRCFVPVASPGCCDKCRAYVRSWKKVNRSAEPTKALRKAHKDKVTVLTKALLVKQRGCCAICHTKAGPWHLDHIMPLCLGGEDAAGNLQVLCATCNLRKGRKDPIAFAQSIGRLI